MLSSLCIVFKYMRVNIIWFYEIRGAFVEHKKMSRKNFLATKKDVLFFMLDTCAWITLHFFIWWKAKGRWSRVRILNNLGIFKVIFWVKGLFIFSGIFRHCFQKSSPENLINKLFLKHSPAKYHSLEYTLVSIVAAAINIKWGWA